MIQGVIGLLVLLVLTLVFIVPSTNDVGKSISGEEGKPTQASLKKEVNDTMSLIVPR